MPLLDLKKLTNYIFIKNLCMIVHFIKKKYKNPKLMRKKRFKKSRQMRKEKNGWTPKIRKRKRQTNEK